MQYKQALVVRRDLELSPGKLGAQTGHAAQQAAEEASKRIRRQWSNAGGKKVILAAEDEQHLVELGAAIRDHELPHVFIRDVTEVESEIITSVGIGPAPAATIDSVTENLPPY